MRKGFFREATMSGVTGLVCAGCGQVVGVINSAALEAMLEDGEAYVCRQCMDRADIEAVPEAQRPEHYAHQVARTMLDAMLAQEPSSINVYG
ncbi:MAG: hypothetical protein M0R37_11775 [Bacteroidales bacterium]|nr:hypothetical protein [Bacteroidales bacterium]